MRILATSDWHGDWVTHGVRRYAEVAAAVDETVEAAIRERCAAYLFIGDLCDPDSGSCVFRSVELALRTALRLAEANIASIWVAGNHDTIEDGTKDTSLTPLRALAGTFTTLGRVHVFEQPGACHVREQVDVDEHRDVRFVALPFTSATHPYDVTQTALRLMAGADKRDLVVASHLHVYGVEPGEETTEMPRGREVWLPETGFNGSVAACLNGHYHRQQRTETGVWIPGSLARLTFCEERNDPGYLIVEV